MTQNTNNAPAKLMATVFDSVKGNFKLLRQIILRRIVPFFVLASLIRIFGFYHIIPGFDVIDYYLAATVKWSGFVWLFVNITAFALLSQSRTDKTKISGRELNTLAGNIFKQNKIAFVAYGLIILATMFIVSTFIGVVAVVLFAYMPVIATIHRSNLQKAIEQNFAFFQNPQFKTIIGGFIFFAIFTAVILGILSAFFAIFLIAFESFSSVWLMELRTFIFSFIWIFALTLFFLAINFSYLAVNPLADAQFAEMSETGPDTRNLKRHSRNERERIVADEIETKDRFSKPDSTQKERPVKENRRKKKDKKARPDRFDFDHQNNRFNNKKDINF